MAWYVVAVIGDEILKGRTHDTNSHFLCKRLHNVGVIVKKVRGMNRVQREESQACETYLYDAAPLVIAREQPKIMARTMKKRTPPPGIIFLSGLTGSVGYQRRRIVEP